MNILNELNEACNYIENNIENEIDRAKENLDIIGSVYDYE